jgi:hypothetical protein
MEAPTPTPTPTPTPSTTIPKPMFKTCDETSLTLGWPQFDYGSGAVRLQYKKHYEEWDKCHDVEVAGGANEVQVVDVIDLEPGTPYFVRLVVVNDVDVSEGPACVFDTKPIDCTPKRKTCQIM